MIQIELKPFQQNDFNRLINWSKSIECLQQWAGPSFTYPLDEFQLENYFKHMIANPSTRKIFKAIDTGTNQVVGHIDLDKINHRNRCARICRVLVGEPCFRGKGIGTQMVKKILEIGFEHLELHRIELNVYDFNEVAIACYEKIGFVKEGYLRENNRVGNEYWSVYRMSMLESEWRALRTLTEERASCESLGFSKSNAMRS